MVVNLWTSSTPSAESSRLAQPVDVFCGFGEGVTSRSSVGCTPVSGATPCMPGVRAWLGLDSTWAALCQWFCSKTLGTEFLCAARVFQGVLFDDFRIGSLLFADDVILLVPSVCDLQVSLDRFAGKMRISTSTSEAIGSQPEKGGVPFQGRSLFLWSRALGSDRKNKVAGISAWNELPLP